MTIKLGIPASIYIKLGVWEGLYDGYEGDFSNSFPLVYCTVNDWAVSTYIRAKNGVKVIGIAREIPVL